MPRRCTDGTWRPSRAWPKHSMHGAFSTPMAAACAPITPAQVHWYQQAAEQGLPQAQYNLGLLLERGLVERGLGAPRNPKEARHRYTRAVAQGLPAAQRELQRRLITLPPRSALPEAAALTTLSLATLPAPQLNPKWLRTMLSPPCPLLCLLGSLAASPTCGLYHAARKSRSQYGQYSHPRQLPPLSPHSCPWTRYRAPTLGHCTLPKARAKREMQAAER
jgi:TPR repeat protein